MSPDHYEGQTVLLAPVEEAEPVVGAWRHEFDATELEGVPAHISILFPFVPQIHIDDPLLDTVAGIVGQHPAIDCTFREARRFSDGNLYLAPEPMDPFRQITQAIWERWPEHPPYEGRFDDIIPHLTVAVDPPPERVEEIQRAVSAELPVSAHVDVVQLLAYGPGRWRRIADFPLGGQSDVDEGAGTG